MNARPTYLVSRTSPSVVLDPVVIDQLGRPLRDLRISVMDRCNFRCRYCMPESGYAEHFLRNKDRLTFDEIERICRLVAGLGVSKLRLTGGEPLLRPGLAQLVACLRRIDGITDLAMTTNAVLLARHANALRDAGLDRITISVDTLDPALFDRMTGSLGTLGYVLDGIAAALSARFPGGVKLNTVVQRGINEHTVVDLIERFRHTGIVPRLIEYMDVGNRNDWRIGAVAPSRELLASIDARWPLQALPPRYDGEVATRYRFRDGAGEIGVVSSISEPFCRSCRRARLASDGRLYTCLFATEGADLRTPLRDGSDDEVLIERLENIWIRRTDRYSEERGRHSERPPSKIEMHYIGG